MVLWVTISTIKYTFLLHFLCSLTTDFCVCSFTVNILQGIVLIFYLLYYAAVFIKLPVMLYNFAQLCLVCYLFSI